jgi:nitronate monooxygenase
MYMAARGAELYPGTLSVDDGLVFRALGVIREIGPLSPLAPAFPFAGGGLAPLRAKAEAAGVGDFTNLWSGQSARLSPRLPSGQLTERLAADALSHFSRLAASTQ